MREASEAWAVPDAPAPSAVGPPTRRQRTLVGFLRVGSVTRHPLEQIEVAAGTLAPEQTRNHLVWGPLALYSASPGRG